jgi:uncharacterized membrane protein YbhN (UPF0104 family)
LGLDLPFREALGEYYRGVFLNQVLPGGVVGDASRAWRHASRSRRAWGAAVRAVLLERFSGQVVMAVFAGVSFVLLAPRLGSEVTWGLVAVVGVGAGVVAAAWRAGVVRTSDGTPMGTFLRDTHAALFTGDAFLVQLTTSSLIVGSYVATYLCAARAVGVGTALGALAPLVPPVLLAMLIPLSVGGWGLREGAAAALWAAVGLVAADGVAISVAYGVLVLLGTLPGAYLLAFRGLGSDGALPPGEPEEVRSRSKRTSSPSTN